MIKKNNFLIGVSLTVVNSLSLGTLGIIDKLGSVTFSNSLVFSTQSVGFSFIFITLFSLFYFRSNFFSTLKRVSFQNWRFIFFVGIFASGLFILLRFLGLTQSTGTFATLSQIITTSLTAILAMFLLREKLSKQFWLFFIAILIAMYFVSVGSFSFKILQAGDLYIIAGAFFLAFANIFSRKAVNEISPVVLAFGRFAIGFIFLFLMQVFLQHSGNNLFIFSPWSVISGFFWTINVLAYNFAIQKIGVTLATSLIMVAPIVTMILEYLILDHTFNLIQITAAGVVILCGVLMVTIKKRTT